MVGKETFICNHNIVALEMTIVAAENYRTQVSYFICYLVAVLIVLYSWSPMLRAQWSMIDDHEIVSLIGSGDGFGFRDIPEALEKTEVSSSSAANRFRPSYYAIRYAEIAAWGANPEYWYAARILIAVLFSLAFTWLCLQVASPLLALGAVIFTLSRPFWVDLFTRLGPAETYGALGLTLVLLGFILRRQRFCNSYNSLFLSLGVVVAVGSKENFLFLAAIPVCILVFYWKKLSIFLKLTYFIPIFYSSWIVLTVLNRLSLSGKDVYSQDVSLDSRASLVFAFLKRVDVLLWAFAIALLFCAFFFERLYRHKAQITILSRHEMIIRTTLVTATLLLLLYFSQYIFYSGAWPNVGSPRYLFPGLLFKYMAVLLLLNLLIRISSDFNFGRVLPRVLAISSLLGLMGFVTVGGVNRNFPKDVKVDINIYGRLSDISSNRKSAEMRVEATRVFTHKMNEIIRDLRSDPPAAIVFNSHGAGDYEPLFSVLRFVRAADISLPIALNFDGYTVSSYPGNQLATDLVKDLDNVRNSKAVDESGREVAEAERYTFTTVDRLRLADDCFSFGFSGDAFARCKRGALIWP
jgi:hypothetical protein